MRNKWPKHTRENRETSARQMHPDRTCGTQLVKHQLIINAQYMEYEASDNFVLISSNRREFEQGGQLMSQKFMIVTKMNVSLTKR